jgi:hypothetical protein
MSTASTRTTRGSKAAAEPAKSPDTVSKPSNLVPDLRAPSAQELAAIAEAKASVAAMRPRSSIRLHHSEGGGLDRQSAY